MRRIMLQRKRVAPSLFALLFLMFLVGVACCSSNTSEQSASAGVVVVKAPATGEVRRVLLNEGATVNQGAVIVEIAVRQELPDASPQSEDPQARARAAAQSIQAQVASARAEAERASVEVERMTALVASNSAPQPQLDAARVQYQRAQEQLQRAQQSASNVTTVLPQQSNAATTRTATTREQIIAVSAPVAGTMSVINAHVGQQVMTGQPLATIRTN